MKLNAEKIKLIVITAAVTLVASNVPTLLQYSPTMVPAAEAKSGHKMLHKAKGQLEAALATLQKSISEYGKSDPVAGHRKKAIEDVTDAISEVAAGIAMP